jgi:hypothetical protein
VACVWTAQASGATVVQIVWSSRRGSRSIEHIGSAHDHQELAALSAAATQRVTAGQTEMDLGLTPAPGSGTLPIVSSRMSHLLDALGTAYEQLWSTPETNNDSAFRDLVLARIIEPTSKVDSFRVLGEVGVTSASYATVERRLPIDAKSSYRQALSAACAVQAGLGPASLLLYDVSTLYFETDTGDQRLQDRPPADRRHGRGDAGMVSEPNQVAIQVSGLSFILGARIPLLPNVVREWPTGPCPACLPPGGRSDRVASRYIGSPIASKH